MTMASVRPWKAKATRSTSMLQNPLHGRLFGIRPKPITTRKGSKYFGWMKPNPNVSISKYLDLSLAGDDTDSVYDFDIYRYHRGSNLSIGNIYPVGYPDIPFRLQGRSSSADSVKVEYARAFYEGMTSAGQTQIVNLLRCAWAGSQKFGALVWSGDIASSWSSFRYQLCAGLNMGIAGIPWWTTDIGGFHGGNPKDEAFRELFVGWFQWGAFCPVMRLHGDREPKQPQHGTTGGAFCRSGR